MNGVIMSMTAVLGSNRLAGGNGEGDEKGQHRGQRQAACLC